MKSNMSLRQKIEYFFMYYKVPVILSTALIAIVLSMFYSWSNRRDYGFSAFFFNASNTNSNEVFSREFAREQNIDTNQHIVSVDCGLQIDGYSQLSIVSTEKLSSAINAQTLDVCVMPEELFLTYAAEGAFGNLGDFLTENQLAAYKDLVVYSGEEPCGIRINDFKRIQAAGLYDGEDAPIYGIVYNTKHPDTCRDFLTFLEKYKY